MILVEEIMVESSMTWYQLFFWNVEESSLHCILKLQSVRGVNISSTASKPGVNSTHQSRSFLSLGTYFYTCHLSSTKYLKYE